jgi:hypothetical protein
MRGKTQISKIRKEKGETTTNTKEIQGIIKDYFENLGRLHPPPPGKLKAINSKL